jgi:hypothetical protein
MIQAWKAVKDQGLGHADEMIGDREQTGTFFKHARKSKIL